MHSGQMGYGDMLRVNTIVGEAWSTFIYFKRCRSILVTVRFIVSSLRTCSSKMCTVYKMEYVDELYIKKPTTIFCIIYT